LVYCICPVSKGSKKIFLGTSGGIYFSTDQGYEWRRDKTLPEDLKVFEIKRTETSQGTGLLYAATSRGVYMKVDN